MLYIQDLTITSKYCGKHYTLYILNKMLKRTYNDFVHEITNKQMMSLIFAIYF